MKGRIGTAVVAATLLTAAAASAQPAKLVCGGSEPFWSLALGAGSAKFEAPDAQLARAGSAFAGTFTPVANRKPGTMVWRGSAAAAAKDLVAVAVPLACEEPSGEKAPYTVWVSLPDGTAVAGCCR